jgi:hypothetical protein
VPAELVRSEDQSSKISKMRRIRKTIVRCLPLALLVYLASFPAQSCDPGARVFFVRPLHKSTVVAPVRVVFGSEIVEVKAAPAGEQGGNVGHYDLLINETAVPIGVEIPAGPRHLRFDRGETEAKLDLPPGKYKLTLQFADGQNKSHGVDVSATVEITVLDRLPSRTPAGT